MAINARPLDFGSFRSVFPVTVLLRGALNVAPMRVELVNRRAGTHAAGTVIEPPREPAVRGAMPSAWS